MPGSSRIQSVLIGVKYRNGRRTLDVYLRFAIWIWQIWTGWYVSYKFVNLF